MKKYFFLLVICCLHAFYCFSQTASNEDLTGTCRILIKLTDQALKNKDMGKVALYCNVFRDIKNDTTIKKEVKDYFELVELKNAGKTKWILTMNNELKVLTAGIVRHIEELSDQELEELEEKIEEVKAEKKDNNE